MPVELAPCLHIGETVVGALVSRSVCCKGRNPAWFYGAKRPLAVLIHQNGATKAFEPDGAPITPEELDLRFPEQRMRFEQLCNFG